MDAQGTTGVKAGRKFRLVSKGAIKRLAVLFVLIGLVFVWAYFALLVMPGRSHSGPLPAATERQASLAVELNTHVSALAKDIGLRSTFNPRGMNDAAQYIKAQMAAYGYGEPGETFPERGSRVPNLAYESRGTSRPSEIIVIGAHYDTYQGTPGADDNASGVAGCLAIAKAMAGKPQARTVRFVYFVNEEPPAFWTPDMGSWVYAKACRASNDDIRAMISIECIGYFADGAGSQKYPPVIGGVLRRLYPDTGNFITFVGNVGSRSLVKRSIRTFREKAAFPSEGVALPAWMPGIGWSDQWAFWQEGYDAIMVTDTAPFRNPNYHLMSDKPHTLDYDRMARVVEGIEHVTLDLAGR